MHDNDTQTTYNTQPERSKLNSEPVSKS